MDVLGLSPFEILLSLAWLGAIGVRVAEWVFKRTHEGDDCVKKADWQRGRRDDLDTAKHHINNRLSIYVPEKLYERDRQEIHRRLGALERHGEGAGV